MTTLKGSNRPTRGRAVYTRYLPIIRLLVRVVALLPRKVRTGLLRFQQSSDAKAVRLVRFAALKNLALSCGELVDVHSQCNIMHPSSLTLGSRISIHPTCYIDATGGLSIGDDVSIAHQTTILSTTHTWGNPDVAIRDQEVLLKPTQIENNVWIGAGCRIRAGVNIGANSIVAAGAVVTRNVPPGSIVAGIPARPVKSTISLEG